MSNVILILLSVILFAVGVIFLVKGFSGKESGETKGEILDIKKELTLESSLIEELKKQNEGLEKDISSLKQESVERISDIEKEKQELETINDKLNQEVKDSFTLRKEAEVLASELAILKKTINNGNSKEEDDIKEIMKELDVLEKRLAEEVDTRKEDEELIQGLRIRIGQLEGELHKSRTIRNHIVAQSKNSLQDLQYLKEIAEEQKTVAQSIKRRVEENKAKYRI